jgi:GDP-D-mannose 3',5'-epimerase
MSDSSPLFAVTGASGFLGDAMIHFLADQGLSVRAISRKKIQFDRINITPLIADLTSKENTASALSDVDYVFHFAAFMGGVGYFSKEQYIPFVNNIQMDINVFEACEKNGVRRLFYPSSACAYPVNLGNNPNEVTALSEEMLIPANADQMYGWEKLVMLLLSRYAPVETRVGILHTVFGERQEWLGPKAKFPAAITYKVLIAKRTGEPIHIWGDGSQVRTFLYITDAIAKIFEVMMDDHYHGEVNISGEEVVTVRQVADWLCEYAGISPNYVFELNQPTGVLRRSVNNSKFNKYYEYSDRVSVKEGFERLYRYLDSRT